MFAALLPGLRDVRVPLTTGFLWLAFLWIALARAVPDPHTADGLAREVYRASSALGSLALASALTFLAYIIGVMTTFRARSMFRLQRVLVPVVLVAYPKVITDRLMPGFRETIAESARRDSVPLSADARRALRGHTRRVLQRLIDEEVPRTTILATSKPLRDAWQIDQKARRLNGSDESFYEWLATGWATRFLLRDVVAYLETSSRRLRKISADDFDDYGRLQAEAEFRLSVALPLCAAIVAAYLYWPAPSPLEFWPYAGWFFLLVGILYLVFFGLVARAMQKFAEANDVLVDAFLAGEMAAPQLQALDGLAERTPGLRTFLDSLSGFRPAQLIVGLLHRGRRTATGSAQRLKG